jgi:hypothetical protein
MRGWVAGSAFTPVGFCLVLLGCFPAHCPNIFGTPI